MRFFLVCVLAVSVACASRANRQNLSFERDQIIVGQTHQVDLLERFGKPDRKGRAAGGKTWIWSDVQSHIAHIRLEPARGRELMVHLDQNGYVTNYRFISNHPGERGWYEGPSWGHMQEYVLPERFLTAHRLLLNPEIRPDYFPEWLAREYAAAIARGRELPMEPAEEPSPRGAQGVEPAVPASGRKAEETAPSNEAREPSTTKPANGPAEEPPAESEDEIPVGAAPSAPDRRYMRLASYQGDEAAPIRQEEVIKADPNPADQKPLFLTDRLADPSEVVGEPRLSRPTPMPELKQGFRVASWGMSKAQVLNLEPGDLRYRDENRLIYETEFEGLPVAVYYFFVNDQLAGGSYLFERGQENYDWFLSRYQRVRTLYERRYDGANVSSGGIAAPRLHRTGLAREPRDQLPPNRIWRDEKTTVTLGYLHHGSRTYICVHHDYDEMFRYSFPDM